MKSKLLLLLTILLSSAIIARANFNFDNRCADAYKAIIELRMNDANSIITEIKQQQPQNGIAILLDNYIDYYTLLITESKSDYEKIKDRRSVRLSALEENDQNSPYYRFSQGEVYLQWSLLKAKFGDYFSSSMDAKKAANLFKENDQKFPDFLPDKMGLAMVNVIFGSIPANLKGITRFMGMTGNVQTGVAQFDQLRVELPKTKYSYFVNEVIFSMCTIYINVLRDLDSYDKLQSYLGGMDDNSALKPYMKGYVASKTGHNDEAISFFEAMPKPGKYLQIQNVNYMLGCARLSRMDSDTPVTLLNYVQNFTGTSFIKDAYLKIAYYYLLKGDEDKYRNYLTLVKTKGYDIDEKDKQALSEANDTKPDLDLLKARFYFDGAYYAKALSQLESKDVNSLKLTRDKTEFYYRLGRIYDKTDKLNDAVINYQRAINFGKATHYYYSANAAVLAGQIFEKKKDFKKAADYYNQAVDMKDHQYKVSIDDDAKAGLKRIGQ